MIFDDSFCATELAQRRLSEGSRAALALDFPEPRKHQLEVGRLDSALVGAAAGGHAATRHAELDSAGRDLVEHVVDECRLDVNGFIDVDERVVTANRTDDRRLSCRTVEPVEPETVCEQVRNRGLQSVEPCERILANPDQHVDAQAGSPEDLRELLRKATPARVVEKQFLEL